jgi:hypothetical protein
MQDRFRFRVWNKRNKEMIYNAEIAYDGMNYNTSWQIGKNTNDGWVDCFGYYLDYPEDYEVMQCTGLKDKNGKLIYEGDIVRIGNGSINGSVIENKRKIEWGINSWNVPSWVIDKPDFSHYVEIIGNIYDNPERLED